MLRHQNKFKKIDDTKPYKHTIKNQNFFCTIKKTENPETPMIEIN
tara:strand:- start:823 stop:957 length:135 start_codon:yes stop_codon:yes gene_type:complete